MMNAQVEISLPFVLSVKSRTENDHSRSQPCDVMRFMNGLLIHELTRRQLHLKFKYVRKNATYHSILVSR